MPTIDDNKKQWDGDYSWPFQGDEWSAAWGGPSMQWYGTILPRIHRFVATDSILEIASGYGRWTQFLKDKCHHLVALDISEECIEACKERFSDHSNIEYHVNDGKSLEMIADDSIDFVFSFDSLVHADESVLEAYISQLNRILKKDGAAFIHHSNLGEHYFMNSTIRRIPNLERLLFRLGINLHWRDLKVSAKLVEELAKKHQLNCISQEIIPWGTNSFQLIDCFSTIVKNNSSLARDNLIVRNSNFIQEIKTLSQISSLYT